MKDGLQQFSSLPFSHHAYGLESSTGVYSNLSKVIPKGEFSYIFYKKYDTLKIDDARTIKSLQIEKTERASVFIIEFTFINKEAQNTLLKVLEEPTPNTYFILIFPKREQLLETLRSRLEIISLGISNQEEFVLSTDKFLSLNLEERFNLNKELTDRKGRIQISKGEVLQFLDNLESAIYGNGNMNQKKKKILEVIFNSRKYLSVGSVSVKMILDNLAIHL